MWVLLLTIGVLMILYGGVVVGVVNRFRRVNELSRGQRHDAHRAVQRKH
jgi:hypothetical protein